VTPTTPLPPNTPQLSDLFNPMGNVGSSLSAGHQLLGSGPGGLHGGSPINVSAAGLLSGPPPSKSGMLDLNWTRLQGDVYLNLPVKAGQGVGGGFKSV